MIHYLMLARYSHPRSTLQLIHSEASFIYHISFDFLAGVFELFFDFEKHQKTVDVKADRRGRAPSRVKQAHLFLCMMATERLLVYDGGTKQK